MNAGVVAIGRNEGDRLLRCLASLREHAPGCPIVYVDSGSTDGSAEAARAAGAAVVDLDLSVPFTAARARNEGAARLLTEHPDLEFIQFLDGDCELRQGWLSAALEAMRDPAVAVVCGRRRERHPDASVYNRLIDLEWDTPVGEARACGGDALVRASAFRDVGGYDPTIIAGEEPEMCLRLRRAGRRILRIDHEMTLHDAALTRFGQWWRRSVRGGHAFAEGAWRYGRGPERYNVRNVASILLWTLVPTGAGLAFAAAGLAAAPPYGVLAGLLPLLAYPLQIARLARRERARGRSPDVARAWAVLNVVCKFAELQGLVTFAARRLTGRRGRIIEYKRPGATSAAAPA